MMVQRINITTLVVFCLFGLVSLSAAQTYLIINQYAFNSSCEAENLADVTYGEVNVCDHQGHSYFTCNATDVSYYNCQGGLDPQCKNCSATDFPIVNKCEGSQLMQCSTQPPQNPFSQALISTAFDTSEGCTGTVIGYGFTKLNNCAAYAGKYSYVKCDQENFYLMDCNQDKECKNCSVSSSAALGCLGNSFNKCSL